MRDAASKTVMESIYMHEQRADYGFYVHHTHLYALGILVALVAAVLAVSMASHKPAPGPGDDSHVVVPHG